MIDFRDKWLRELALGDKNKPFVFDSKGLCQLTLNNEMLLTFFKAEKVTQLVILGQLIVSGLSQGMMQKMLISNRNNAITASPIVSLSENMKAIEIHLVLSPQELKSKTTLGVERIVEALEYWREQITNEVGSQPQPTSNRMHFI